ncbi:hemoglobin/transferrin/lactoferrin receptor protein [Beijerinckia sp. GAS462]|nr:hemoglobin/transferrin/lactoferrin receptor protein [Beijerinckia sp. GAS462]SEB67646.1 hemoglobin/transferrin/lactoferrin receptor protein [Beijerinckia sp. 28-YEA-48]
MMLSSGSAALASNRVWYKPSAQAWQLSITVAAGMMTAALSLPTTAKAQSNLPSVTVDAPATASHRAATRPARIATPARRAPARVAAPRAQAPVPVASAPATNMRKAGRDSLLPRGGQLPQVESLKQQVTQSATVIERAQIEQTSPTGLLDILATVPGISIARAGGIGGQIYLRGFSSNNFRSPLYVDGDRFRGRNTLQLNYFAPGEIERVEVIRGPASVLYGSEALTGLVNVVTRKPAGDINGPFKISGGGVSSGYGSAAKSLTTDAWLQGAGNGFDFLASVNGRWGDNYQTPLGAAPNSDYRSLGGSLKLGYTPTAGQRVELSFRRYTETDGRAGGVGGAPGAPYLNVRQSPNEVTMGRLAYTGEFDGLVKKVEASVYVNYFDTYLKTINNTINARNIITRSVESTSHVIGPLVVGGRVVGTIPWSFGIGEVNTLVGADAFKEFRPGSEGWSATRNFTATTGALTSTSLVTPAKNGPDTTQTNAGIFMLHEWTPVRQLTLSAGGRFDWFNTTTGLAPLPAAVLPAFLAHSQVASSAPTGSIGAVYRILPNFDLLASVATSFRQPTNSELFAFSATTVPNPALKPESGVTYEGGFRFHMDNATLKVTAFNSRYENFLQTTAVTYNGVAGFTQSQNIGKAEVSGLELEGRWQASETVNIFGTVAYLRGDNKTTGRPLPFLAPWRGRVGVQYAAPDASYSVMGVVDWASAKTRIDTTQEYATGGYVVPKIYATLQLGKLISPTLGDTRLVLGIENIFNKTYVDASTFVNRSYAQSMTNPLVEMGRNFTVKLQHNF